jgi:predicted DNA binding CopG/RHH family protein
MAKSEKRETTSIKIKPDTWKEAKKRAIDKGITFSEYIEQLIEKDISSSR